ncbi:hypothetical protein vseg_017799 [Gypsophila vaccaria]
MDKFGTATSAPRPILALAGHNSVCWSCGGQGHHASECMGLHEQLNAFQNWRPNAPYQNQPGFDRSLLFYRSQNVLNPQPLPPPQQPYVPPHRSFQQPQQSSQFQRPTYNAPPPSPPNSDITEIKEFLKQSISVQARQQETISQIMAHNKILDTQIAQLAKANSTPEKPKEQPHETLNVVTVMGEIDANVSEEAEKGVRGKQPQLDRADPARSSTRLPFPNRQWKVEKDSQFERFMETVKGLQVTIPFTEVSQPGPCICKVHEGGSEQEEEIF